VSLRAGMDTEAREKSFASSVARTKVVQFLVRQYTGSATHSEKVTIYYFCYYHDHHHVYLPQRQRHSLKYFFPSFVSYGSENLRQERML
jgi:hypothetical protein